MDRRYGRVLGLFLCALVAACQPADSGSAAYPSEVNAARHLDAPYVVMLSLDGFRHDYLDRYPTPTFQRISAEGARAEAMIPTFPTKTFPSHYSIATGLYAENHGLVGNTFWAPDKDGMYRMYDREAVEDGTWYRGEPIWVTAERQGMRTAAYFFVGTEADVGGVRPTNWKRYDDAITNAQRVDSVLTWLDLPPERRPHLITFYFSDLDDTGHAHGPDSPEVAEAVASVDGHIARLLDGIEALPHGNEVYLVIVSDHGMMKSEASRAYPLDLALFPGVRMVESGTYASLWVDEGGVDRIPALRDSIQALLPEGEVWARTAMPERFHYRTDPRIGDIVIVSAPGSLVVSPDRVPEADAYSHGWDNAAPEMAGVFMAWGPDIEGGQVVPAFESVHVYPFLAEILGLTPAPVDGNSEVLAPVRSGRD